MEESVLVVSQNLIKPLLVKIPFNRSSCEDVIKAVLDAYAFVPRSIAEADESIKQIIPYVLCRYEGRYYMTQRTKKQGEQRLHGKWSLGVGGHINNETDRTGYKNLIEASMFRELDEEVRMSSKSVTPIGTIYDPTTAVGRVHVGLVYRSEALSPDFTVMEPEEHINAQWASLDDIAKVHDGLEDWSRILFDQFITQA